MRGTSGKGRGKERIVREGGEDYLKAKETRYGLVYQPVEKIANILPKVKIEFGCLSMDEPVEEKTIRSYYSAYDAGCDDMAVPFKTVVPTRTFLEKMFLLHEEFQKERPRSLRMSCHLYDLERLMDTAYGKDALAGKKLYETIVKHRETFNRLDGIDYALHSPETIGNKTITLCPILIYTTGTGYRSSD